MGVNWLVVGIGDLTTKRVIPAIQAEPRSTLYGVVTRDPKKAERYPGARAYTAIDDALGDSAIDAVYVASPVALHAPQTIAALRAGKHVLCEKPIGLNYSEAHSMKAVAEETGRLLGIGFYRRLFPKFLRTKQLIAEGVIGQPLFAEAHVHTWLENQDRPWLHDPKMAGAGPLLDTAVHRFDLFNFLFGDPVDAVGLRSNAVHHLPVEDSATATVAYANGIRAVVDVRWNSRIVRDQFRVIGTEGEINLDPVFGPELLVNGKLENHPAHANVQYPLVENFAGAVSEGTPVLCPVSEGMKTDWITTRILSNLRD